MSITSWLRKRASNSRSRGTGQRRPCFRPQLEALDDRIVPSTLTVTTAADPFSLTPGTLRYEIGKAHNGDTIVFAPTLDGQTIWLNDSELDITKSLTIQGPGAGQLTIDGRGPYGSRVFEVAAKTSVTLSGLTITDGSGLAVHGARHLNDHEGGGILNFGTLTISSCTISGNDCDPASGNSYGGGIYNAGTLTVSNSAVSSNFANPDADGFGEIPAPHGYGGGIYNAGTLTVSSSAFSGNRALTDGGGIYNAGTATVSSSAFSGNHAQYGGGVYNAGTLTVSGCTVSGNYAGANIGGGAGIYNAGTLTVTNSVFSNNIDGLFSPDNIHGPYTDGGGNTFM
jgi:hypothetical protein